MVFNPWNLENQKKDVGIYPFPAKDSRGFEKK